MAINRSEALCQAPAGGKPLGRTEVTIRVPICQQPEDLISKQTTNQPNIWDVDAALERVEGDEAFLRELVEVFLAHARELLLALEHALDAGNRQEVQRVAHALKGCAAELSATAMAGAARCLEESIRQGDLSNLSEKCQSVKEESVRLERILSNWLSS